MPMLTTLRMGLPVWPFQSPDRTRSAKPLMRVEHLVHLRHDVDPVDHERGLPGHAQGHVQHGAVLGDVDVLARRTSRRVAPRRPDSSASSTSRRSVSSVMRFFE